jgi:membrane protein implicated in regulation of membrane protease activity
MEIFGISIEAFYLTTLIIAGVITLLYLLFGDFLEGVAEATVFLNPTLILAFITFTSASGYIFELLTAFNHLLIFILSVIIAIILDVLLNVFVLIPLSSAEESLVYTTESLKGRVGKVIIPIPENGFGEVVIKNNSGIISKAASSFENKVIAEGEKVLVIEVEDGVLKVLPYENFNQFLSKEE